jgi:phosphoglycerate dehydrogenase-like enzyme
MCSSKSRQDISPKRTKIDTNGQGEKLSSTRLKQPGFSHDAYTMKRRQGIYIGTQQAISNAYSPQAQTLLAKLLDLRPFSLTREQVEQDPSLLKDVQVIMTTWGMVRLDDRVLDEADGLELVCYAAGSVKYFVTDTVWQRGVRITHAAAQNAVPVAEFTHALVVMALKQAFRAERLVREQKRFARSQIRGAFRTRVGLVSLGVIGRMVAERLRALDIEVVAYDPSLSPEHAASLGVKYVSLEELFATSDVVSLHTPWFPQTEGLVNRALLSSMRPGATLINTSRGAVVDEAALIETLGSRPDLFALLDVTYPEPPVPGSPFYTLPNVVLFPHIAGSMGQEVWRMGDAMVDELGRYLAGEPMQQEVRAETLAMMA